MPNELIATIVGFAILAIAAILIKRFCSTLTPEKIAFISKSVGYIAGTASKTFIKNESIKNSIISIIKNMNSMKFDEGVSWFFSLRKFLLVSIEQTNLESNDKHMLAFALESLVKGFEFILETKFKDTPIDFPMYTLISNAFISGALFSLDDAKANDVKTLESKRQFKSVLKEYNRFVSEKYLF